jgi:hypothetical protein
MTRDQLRDTYSRRIIQFQNTIRRHSRQMNYLSMARFMNLVLLVYLLVLGVRSGHVVYYLLTVLSAVLFLCLVSRFNRQKELRELNTRLKNLNEKEVSCLEHSYTSFPDGREYADPSHPWSHDLDLFGKGSLYQYLNRTSIPKGSDLLADLLTTEPEGPEQILHRQGIIGDMKDRLDFRQLFTAQGAMIREKKGDLQGISDWLDVSSYIVRHRWLFYLAAGFSCVSAGIIVCGILHPPDFWYLLPMLALNFTILSPFLLRTNRYQQTISRKHEMLEGYARLLRIMAETGFEHPRLRDNGTQARRGMREVARLSKLLNIFDQRLNMLLGVVFNGLFLFDFIMLHLLERWKRSNRDRIMEWIGLAGWTDAMVSLAGFAFNHPGYVMPEMTESQETMEMKGLGHPLIPSGKLVVNDLSIARERIVIITGANMAGKSTFLRSLGINMVLAYTGCPVCATQFTTRFMVLCSSMRTADSLAEEESYFLAEIRKLQRIVQRMETGVHRQKEGFRGTDQAVAPLPCPLFYRHPRPLPWRNGEGIPRPGGELLL